MPDAPDTTSIKHRALTLTVRTPQCGHTVWGKTTPPKKKSLKNAKEKIGRKNKKHARLCCVALDFWFVFSVCFGCAPRSLSIFLCNPTLCLLGSSSHAFQLFNFFQPRWLASMVGTSASTHGGQSSKMFQVKILNATFENRNCRFHVSSFLSSRQICLCAFC